MIERALAKMAHTANRVWLSSADSCRHGHNENLHLYEWPAVIWHGPRCSAPIAGPVIKHWRTGACRQAQCAHAECADVNGARVGMELPIVINKYNVAQIRNMALSFPLSLSFSLCMSGRVCICVCVNALPISIHTHIRICSRIQLYFP